ncbi:MAG: glutamine-hydrolyzing GMP synthase, partial [Anaerovoracaceae bacterium]|nr:glutamine-hydrolyzing GMP synthase [Anaerovoracaceae bacterium]
MQHECILVLDFGGQYNQLIARRVRECGVYAEVHPYTMTAEEIRAMSPKGIIFTGGPNSAYGENALKYDKGIFDLGIPILGICYGAQLIAAAAGGRVEHIETSEFGHTDVKLDNSSVLFKNLPSETVAWMSHSDTITAAPDGFRVTAESEHCPVAGFENPERGLYATQFHPEVQHTRGGTEILRAFVIDVCGCSGDWEMSSFIETTTAAIKEKVGDGRALCALSGGVDSSVAAV